MCWAPYEEIFMGLTYCEALSYYPHSTEEYEDEIITAQGHISL